MSERVAPRFKSWKATTNAWRAFALGGTRRAAKRARASTALIQVSDVSFGPSASGAEALRYVCYTLDFGNPRRIARRLFRAKRRQSARFTRLNLYSITSSARASKVAGMVRPSAFAVFRLITNSNL